MSCLVSNTINKFCSIGRAVEVHDSIGNCHTCGVDGDHVQRYYSKCEYDGIQFLWVVLLEALFNKPLQCINLTSQLQFSRHSAYLLVESIHNLGRHVSELCDIACPSQWGGKSPCRHVDSFDSEERLMAQLLA